MKVRRASVALLSAALLGFQVLWLRLFAIHQPHHFAYMAVGVALLGIGASGTALALLRERLRGREAPAYAWCGVGLALSLLAAPVAVGLLPFEPTQIVWDPSQWLVVGAVVFALAVPFFLGGACIALALQHDPARSAAVYGASLLGSGAGAAGALAVLVLVPPQASPAAAAAVAAAGTALALERRRGWLPWAVAVLGVLSILSLARPPWRLTITPYKALPQARAYPEVTELGSAWDPTAWVVALDAPALRYAPGLSLGFSGAFPSQLGLFADAEWAGAVTRLAGAPTGVEFVRWLPSAAPYALGGRDRVLVLGAGAGVETVSALAHGAREVVAVELSPSVVALADRVGEPGSAPYRLPGVTAVVGDARRYLRGSDGWFDLVQLGPAGSFGAAAGGLHGLDADYLNTVEAYADALRRLAPGGAFAVTRWLRTPARDNVKVIATAAAALRRLGHDDVGSRFAVLRSWANVVVIVKPSGFAPDEAERLRAFARSRLFDLDWLGGPAPDAPAFNLLESPVFAEVARAVAAGPAAAEAFFRDYPFAVRPATDARPFFGRFLSVRQAIRLLGRPASEWAPYAEWGTLVLLATLAQGFVLAALLVVAPAAWARRRFGTLAARAAGALGAGTGALYFGALGLGYLFVEMALIQRLQLWLGHPVYAVAATLAAFLMLSGLGSLWFQPRSLVRGWWAPGVVAAMIPLYAWIFWTAAAGPARLPLVPRVAAVFVLLLPLATAMGVPFPLGLRRVADRTGIAWAWAVNGFASVVAVPAAVLLSMEAGFFTLLLAGGAAYALAAAALAVHERRR